MTLPTIDELIRLSLEKFIILPKSGKPNSLKEWTVLSTIIQYDSETKKSKVVALGTGTKCIGKDNFCSKGMILNDSHAEVIVRRTFLKYVYENLKHNSEIFYFAKDIGKFGLKESITFHFVSTHPPCGDATIENFDNIMDKSDLYCNQIAESSSSNFQLTQQSKTECEPKSKRLKLTEEQIFTGAKLLGHDVLDPMEQKIGAVRTKPGRGIRTLSMSCSDKLSRWVIIGIQGALLDFLLIKPIYMKSFNFCGPVSKMSISRAIYKRWNMKNFQNNRYNYEIPEIRTVPESNFEYFQPNGRVACPSSICWCDISENSFEIAINGKKQGVTKKNSSNRKAALNISKIKLFEKFLQILNTHVEIKKRVDIDVNLINLTYLDCKKISKEYQEAWEFIKLKIFCNWTSKPKDLLLFNQNKE